MEIKTHLETEQHLGGGVVRAVAMDTTDGLCEWSRQYGRADICACWKKWPWDAFLMCWRWIDDGSALGLRRA